MKTSKFLKIRTKYIITAVLTLMAIVTLAITNPGKSRFGEFIQQQMNDNADDKGKVAESVTKIIDKPAALFMKLDAQRTNNVLFSVYNVELLNHNRVYVGILDSFVRVK